MVSLNQRAVDRNLHETIRALRENHVLTEIEKYQAKHAIYGPNFFSISYFALFNSMMGHVSKILDLSKGTASFWFIYQEKQIDIEQLKSYKNEKITHLKDLASRVKHVRDKTLFHIDRGAVFDPKKIWHNASIKGNQLKLGLDYLYDLLYELCDDAFKASKFHIGYDGNDIHALLEYARLNELCVFVEEG